MRRTEGENCESRHRAVPDSGARWPPHVRAVRSGRRLRHGEVLGQRDVERLRSHDTHAQRCAPPHFALRACLHSHTPSLIRAASRLSFPSSTGRLASCCGLPLPTVPLSSLTAVRADGRVGSLSAVHVPLCEHVPHVRHPGLGRPRQVLGPQQPRPVGSHPQRYVYAYIAHLAFVSEPRRLNSAFFCRWLGSLGVCSCSHHRD